MHCMTAVSYTHLLEEPEAAKKCIGYLPEMPPLYFDMTVLEYMKDVYKRQNIYRR